MRLGIITVGVLLGIALNVRAEENVMVDLSVLEGLNTSYIAPTQPLFPVLPKKNRISTPVKINKPALPVKMKPQRSSQAANEQAIKQNEQKATNQVLQEEEEIVVVDVEPASPQVEKKTKAVDIKPSPEVKVEVKPQVIKEEALPQSKEKVLPVKTITQEPIKNDIVSIMRNETDIKVEETEAAKDTDNPGLLVDEKAFSKQTKEKSSAIKFASEADTLSPEQKVQIDAIIARFENAKENKIAIYSYNQDDGTDSFKKKRISLNRAIEIRSYLIKQGYKNFSIKVVNINAGSDKTDIVELEEIKK